MLILYSFFFERAFTIHKRKESAVDEVKKTTAWRKIITIHSQDNFVLTEDREDAQETRRAGMILFLFKIKKIK